MTNQEEKQDNRKRCLLLIDEVVVTKIKMLALESGTTFSKYMEELARKEIKDKNFSLLGERRESDSRQKRLSKRKKEEVEEDV